MCRAFSAVATKNNKVIWKVGIDSHDELISRYKIEDDTTDGDVIKLCRVEITPNDGYLYPDGEWTFKVDERTTPRWWNKTREQAVWEAWKEWKTAIYSGINLEEARNPTNPFKIKAQQVTELDIRLLKEWASVGDSVGASVGDSVGASVMDSVGASVGDSVRDSVWDSVWTSVGDSVGDSVRTSVGASVRDLVGAYIGSLFPGIKTWKNAPKTTGYPYQCCVDLWKRGFVPSFDGAVWRLHAGKKAKIVFEIAEKELLEK